MRRRIIEKDSVLETLFNRIDSARISAVDWKLSHTTCVDEQPAPRRPVFPSARGHSFILPACRRHRFASRSAAGGGGNAGWRATRSIAFRSALARGAALALSVGHHTTDARHPELSLSRVAAWPGPLHVHRRDGIPSRHRRAQTEELDRRIARWHGHALRAGRRTGVDSLSPDGLVSKENFPRGGNALPRRVDVHHRIPDARANYPFQETYRHHHGDGGAGCGCD